jgi:hypothetical protein
LTNQTLILATEAGAAEGIRAEESLAHQAPCLAVENQAAAYLGESQAAAL